MFSDYSRRTLKVSLPGMTFDILIKNGQVLDGIGSEPLRADVGITGGTIKAVGNLEGAGAGREIEAAGKFVAPGFIDIQNHSDSYLTLFEIPAQQSMVTQGVTTIAVGHCGSSLAPLSNLEALRSVQKWHSLAGANLNWLTFPEYLQALAGYPLGVNVTSLVGHSTLRRGLVRDAVRPVTPEELNIIEKLLQESLAAGAAGLSLGLVYAHEADTSREELVRAAKVVARAKKLVSVHLRSEGSHVVQAVEEIIAVAKTSGNPRVKISHFKIRGRPNWPHAEELLASLDRAYQQGLDIFFDVYPYTTSWTVLYTYLPKWAYEGGRANILQNVRNRETREKILAYLRGYETNLGSIFIATSETNSAFVGKTLAQVAANQEVSVEEALLNVISGTNAQVVVFDHNLSEEVLYAMLKHPLSVVGSDGAGYDFVFSPVQGLVHPRCFGTMPKFLAMVRDKKLMSWGEAVKKITSRPAEKLGLLKRGKIQEGYAADIVVFEPLEIGSRASYENPYVAADGIEHVFVNGKMGFARSEITESSGLQTGGQVLRL